MGKNMLKNNSLKEPTEYDGDQSREVVAASELVNGSRRRLTKAGLAATPIIMTLAGRPVWGNGCGPSAMASGNHSGVADNTNTCSSGWTPSQWYTEVTTNTQYTQDDTYNYNNIFGTSYTQNPTQHPTIVEVLQDTPDWHMDSGIMLFAKQAMTAYLNAATFPQVNDYLSPGKVIWMVQCINHNGYVELGGTMWGAGDVAFYFMKVNGGGFS